MPPKLFQVLVWAKKKGEVKALDRIRVKVLPVTIKEKLSLKEVNRNTACSTLCLKTIIKAAEDVIGIRCPITA